MTLIGNLQWLDASNIVRFLQAEDFSGGQQNSQGPFIPAHVVMGNKFPCTGPALVPNNATFAQGQIIAQSATAASCAGLAVPVSQFNKTVGVVPMGSIERLRLKTADSAWYNKSIRVHIHESAPSFTNGSGGVWAGGVTSSGWCGSFDLNFNKSFSDGTKGIATPNEGELLNFSLPSGGTSVFLTFEALEACTVSFTTFTPLLETIVNP